MYERYCKARDAKGMTDAQVAEYCKFSKSTLSDWKSGRGIPKLDKITKIADCLGVSLDYLANGKEFDSNGYYLNSETAEIAQEIFENKELRALFDASQDASPEDLKALYTMALALKRKEGGNNE